MTVQFCPGRNMAMKVPAHEYEATLRFYRDVLRFELLPGETPRFRFGDKVLWIDRVETLSQAEIWLEVLTDDIEAAADYLKAEGITRRDDIEPLPEGLHAFWLSSPSNIIHLLASDAGEG
ncbi:hypothetical protein [Natronospira bacteriovora]|uniref:VOC domain-containing protein n=1 Tax=Natronospira bacteriovora TaxID=3069753 RepID=A0ABU0W438_9GAMM|nr:hypothetical protein [Natronospira sp. AB-CW4]MDQ2068782.1 hypothetical protein [Natronospira sp. AB-CW4]